MATIRFRLILLLKSYRKFSFFADNTLPFITCVRVKDKRVFHEIKPLLSTNNNKITHLAQLLNLNSLI